MERVVGETQRVALFRSRGLAVQAPDGIGWNEIFANPQALGGIAWGADTFVAVGIRSQLRSADGQGWGAGSLSEEEQRKGREQPAEEVCSHDP